MTLEFLSKLSAREMEEFKKISNKLLSICFLCKKNEANKNDYYFILRHKEEFNSYFKILGFQIEINEEYGVAQLVNTLNFNRIQLKLFDSIILLLLRVLFDEKIRELSLTNDVVVTVGEIQEKFMALKIRDKLIDKTTLNNSLKLFKRFNIINNLDRDLTNEDSRIIIYHSILMALRVDDIKAVYDKINIYKKGGEAVEEVEEDETY
ncbi:hypothetical protein C1I91_19185 [Clostridium manihotivorum]|uniref:DUF4194 domain-containing protein n=1 Tax=Clostridium manihotivorum TaxID=2320868 RepID=A0A410E224_9CLOT|nr:DUF4194 domain-containing protein [Clostridium manihotivorum]QAA35347.1 hypothetical protein C1I91_19185 [Clostridium manihotivorum]